jgi:glycosyltransferase AglD
LKNPEPTKELSILLPAYNEAEQIERCVHEVAMAVNAYSNSYEIIVSEDGSTDGTNIVVSKIAEGNPNLVLLHTPMRLGKGKGIKNALRSSKGKIIVFMDVDLATDLTCLPKLLNEVRKNGGMAIGSRHIAGACVQRRFTRTLSSLTYNAFVRLLFSDGIHDHQCGFKIMTRQVAETVLHFSRTDGFFFDTEMILRCKKLGFPVKEVPVKWNDTNRGGSKVNLLHDGKKIGIDMLRFRLNLQK